MEPCTPACVEHQSLFQSDLLEEPSKAQTRSEQAIRRRMTAEAEQICLACPMMAQCLYRAVVQHEVAGFCGGTTQRQRHEMRRSLGITMVREDFSALSGAPSSGQNVDHSEIIRMRDRYPADTLSAIANRLGCSLSTIKRHLRLGREMEPATSAPPPGPSRSQVLRVYQHIVGKNTTR